MALGARGYVRIGATIAGCALVAACTPDQPPAVTPTPAPSPTPTSAVSTPVETDIERKERLAYAAAESAYKSAVEESDRVARAGGSERVTPALGEVAAGDYLRLQMSSLSNLKKRGHRQEGGVTIVGVKRDGGYQPDRVRLLACEDNSTWKIVDKSGKNVTPKDVPDYVQSLIVRKIDGSWKVWDGATRQVQHLPLRECQS